MDFYVKGDMKTPETSPLESVYNNLNTLETSMRHLLNELSSADRIAYLNGMIMRLYNVNPQPVSAPEKIRLVLAHRKGSTLSAEQQEKIRMLSDLTNQLYDLGDSGKI